jgi:uncharacterized Tic20 family protein
MRFDQSSKTNYWIGLYFYAQLLSGLILFMRIIGDLVWKLLPSSYGEVHKQRAAVLNGYSASGIGDRSDITKWKLQC